MHVPKSIWNGTITFGMVNVPVKLYSATESKSVHFHEVHAKDGARIEHRPRSPLDSELSRRNQVLRYPTRAYQSDHASRTEHIPYSPIV